MSSNKAPLDPLAFARTEVGFLCGWRHVRWYKPWYRFTRPHYTTLFFACKARGFHHPRWAH